MKKLNLSYRFAFRELLHAKAKLRLVVFILTIGFIGPFFSSTLSSSVANYLESNSRQILSADLAVTSMRPFLKKELDWLKLEFGGGKTRKIARETEFVSMAKGKNVAALVEVKGVDPEFPIYGTFKFKNAPSEGNTQKLHLDQNADPKTEYKIAWAYPEVMAQLGLKVGEKVGIGNADFKIVAVLEEAPGVGRTGGFAPRIYIGRKFIEETGLVQTGAQVFHRIYLELPGNVTPAKAGARVKSHLRDSDIFVRTPDDAIQGFERFFKFFSIYLVSVTMIVFVLSWVSGFYILQIYLQERLKSAAVLMINGGTRWSVALLYSFQICLLMFIAFGISGGVSLLIGSITNHCFTTALPPGFVLRPELSEILKLVAVCLVSAFAFNFPFAIRIYFLPLQTLLGESVLGTKRISRLVLFLSYFPLIFVFFAMAALLMESVANAGRIVGGMFLAAGIGFVVGRFLFRGFFGLVKSRPGFLRLVATSLSRSRFGINLCFLALVLVGLALNLVPHLLSSVESEIMPLQGKEVPALFLFNIPDSGLESLQKFALERSIELRFISPLVLGRLNFRNGNPIEIDQFRRFPVRLSYRSDQIPSEKITAGEFPRGDFKSGTDHIAEISVETKFAERNGFRLGDLLDFEIQSVPIQGRITSMRRVRWTSFNPNFFFVFQKGVFDDAPKTWIANVNLVDAKEAEFENLKVKTQFELTRDFPDITVIDIGRTVRRILEVARSVIGPVRAAAWISVMMSFFIFIGIVIHNLRLRENEIDIAKLLGADAAMIRNLIVAEYGVSAFFAWLVGAGSATLLAWLIMDQILDLSLVISVTAILSSLVFSVLAALIIAWLAVERVLMLRGASRKL